MTAQEVYELALALLDDIESDGTVSDDTEDSYGARAIPFINSLQYEIAYAEGIEPKKITSLSDELVISKDSCYRVLQYGLAAKFALADQSMDMYSVYQSEYKTALRTIKASESAITDSINIMSGF